MKRMPVPHRHKRWTPSIHSIAVVSVMSLALQLAACSGGGNNSPGAAAPMVSQPAPTPTGIGLSVAELLGSATPDLSELARLARPVTALDASIPFAGRLSFSQARFSANLAEEADGSYLSLDFPGFALDLVSDGDELIPLQRGLISSYGSGSSYWDVVVGTGGIWHDSADQGWQRGSLPLSLVSRRTGQLRNCVALFLFDALRSSNAYVQCSQESSPVDVFNPGDLRALVPLRYEPQMPADLNEQIAIFRAQQAQELPWRDWSELGANQASLRSQFNRDAQPESRQSLAALVVDGALFVQAPQTRHGSYPYPSQLRVGAFSVTKSAVGALALLHLAERYGDEIFEARISDYVPPLADHPTWEGVRFVDALNMSTGLATDDSYAFVGPFQNVRTAAARMAVIASYRETAGVAGTDFRYASLHSFTLSYALQGYVRAREGADANYWKLVEQQVLAPLGIHNLPLQQTIESDPADAIPILGWGAFLRADEAAKIALLFSAGGAHQGRQLLHRERTLDAINRSSWPGIRVNSTLRYKHSFWTTELRPHQCAVAVSYMEGHGGNYIALLPSGVVVLRFMDHNAYDLAPMVAAAEALRPSC